MVVNFARREIMCKIVYYGPGLCGKTTNLQAIHLKVPENMRGNLTSVATKQDRTLFFDLLPLDIGKIKDFAVRLQLYTVPGQVYYNASRKIVLKGVDGVVFVADSQQGKMDENVESFKNLRENLRENGADPATIPLVLQYNKRDLAPVYEIEELNRGLNPHLNISYFESIANTGQGVFNTLKKITQMVVDDIKIKLEAADRVPAAKPVAAPTPAPAPVKPVAEPVAVAETPQPATVKTAAAEEPVTQEPEQATVRKGFWSRIAGWFKRTGK